MRAQLRHLFTTPGLNKRPDNARPMKTRVWASIAAAWLPAACTPALDWREVRPEGSGLALLMPCKPDSQVRAVGLAATQVRLSLHACSAAGVTWALAFADVGDPAKVTAALSELRASAQENLRAADAEPLPLPLKVEGATPNDASQRVQFTGRMPDGRVVTEQMAGFAKGTRVFQAVALGPSLESEAMATFFGNLRLLP